ncbi:unnamed protein product [Paramecium sonneborni]|uniref:EGF-like domain-containing protein n=1 Tax=Paramecium sonneborni TaxID=65129 RepID=A0A8S1JZ54_9CILI|nr:unnamed protein product [Paramecium sonneborni]
MINLIRITLLFWLVQAQYKLILQGPNSKKMNCKAIDKDLNGFTGQQYFYEKLSNYGQYTNLDKVTFRLWFMVYSKMRMPGKQILFAFLDGYDSDSYINLLVYYKLEQSKYQLYVLNEKMNPELMNLQIEEENNFFIGYWNFLLISIDQTSGDTFLNLKLFSTYNYQLLQVQDALPSQKLRFKFGTHSRITNEQLFEKIDDYKGCVYIANFEYLNGWATMDRQIYFQDQIDLKYSLKPYQNIGLNVDQQFQKVKLRSEKNIEYSGNIGLNIYRDSRILYDFDEKTDLTIIFWMKPQSIISIFQIISFTDEYVKQISLGFGINQDYQLLMFQNKNQIQTGILNPNQWQHITVEMLEISRDQYFKVTNAVKMVNIYIDAQQVYLQQIQGFKQFKRLLIGSLKLQNKGQEVIDIQDIKIFNGYGIQESKGDCQLFVGLYCAYCKALTHYCKEQDPLDDVNVYDCPAGYKLENGICKPNTIANCLRQKGGACIECEQNTILYQGICQTQINQNRVTLYPCTGTGVVLCQITNVIKKSEKTLLQKAKLCSSNLYNSKYECAGNQVQGCKYSQYQGFCQQCKESYYMTELKTCVQTCFKNKIDRFAYINKCVKECPYKYTFTHPCPTYGGQEPILGCSLTPNCQLDEIDLGYTCLSGSQKEIGKSVGCRPILVESYAPNQELRCHHSCKYCFGTTDRQCLGCYEEIYFTPYLGMCLLNCSDEKENLFIYHNQYIWKCELKCPSNLLTQDDQCVEQCINGYQALDGICISVSTIHEYYLSTEIIEINGITSYKYTYKYCPVLCKTCENDSKCNSCINKYPFENDICKFTCFPRYLLIANPLNSCKDQCDPGELIFWNDNLFGYQIAQCFQKKCGEIEADQIYQSFLHQNDQTRCVYPCDDGYYGNREFLECKPCYSSCATCLDQSQICTSCITMLFLKGSTCLTTCGKNFKNFMNWICESECSSGYTIKDNINNIYVCVEECGQLYATYLYKWNQQCYENIPNINVFCLNYECEDCHSSCQQCQGPTSNDCLVCNQDSYLLNNQCVIDCQMFKYDQKNWKCVEECPIESLQSSGISLLLNKSIIVCGLTCKFETFQFRNQCYDQQPDETFCIFRTDYYFCELCSSLCTKCSSTSSTDCQECIPTAFQYGTSCFMECPEEAPLKNTENKQCVQSCSTAFSEDGYCVEQCQSISFIQITQNACYTDGCPISTFNQAGSKICQDCYFGCATCFGSSQNECLSCIPGFFLDQQNSCSDSCHIEPNVIEDWINGRCVQFCPLDSFLQLLNNGHFACKETCPEYYYSNICVSHCPSQTYQNGYACISCAAPCSICFGNTINQCNQCDTGYYLYQTTCYSVCPDENPYGNIIDHTCVPICPDFLYLPKKLCFNFCPYFLYRYEITNLKLCVDECLSKSYLQDQQCFECDPICTECFGPANGNCLQCELPYFLNGQTCELICPTFYDLTDHICKAACPVNLVIQDLYCQPQCDQDYLLYGQNCITECPQFTYLENNSCNDCNLYCLSCFGPTISQCYTCIEGFYLNGQTCQQKCDDFYNQDEKICIKNCGSMLIIKDLKFCVQQCPIGYITCEQECFITIKDGFYLDNNLCYKCDSKCTKCTSSHSCSECYQNFYLELDSCVNFCQNQFLYMDPISRSCVSKCPIGLYHQESFNKRFCMFDCSLKLNDQCVQSCPTGFYNDFTICKQCPFECYECYSITKCTTCKPGLFLENNWCYPQCNIKKTDRKSLICVDQCDSNLFEFENQCVEICPSDPIYFHYNSKCVNTCPTQTFQSEQSCIDCHIQCSSCFGANYDQCYSCSFGYYLEDNQICTQTCSHFYDLLNLKCVLQCQSDLFQEEDKCVQKCIHFVYKKQCVDICPYETYEQNSECFNCPNNCLECNSFGCIKCQVGTYLNDGLCDSYCLIMYNDVKNECVEICTNEEYQYIDHCYSECPINTLQYKQNCLLNCPQKTVQFQNLCFNCPERCDICLNEYECLKCNSLYFLFEGSCVLKCPLSLPYEDTVNSICSYDCPPNTFTKKHTCVLTCDLIIHQKMCLDQCPKGYYENIICKPCKLECLACNDFDYCTECNINYYLEDNQCDMQCTKIKDLKTKQCVETCNQFLYQNICYEQCPKMTFEFKSICILQCPDGFYGSTNFICEQCPFQCLQCSSQNKCEQCKIGYFLFQNFCLEICPYNTFSNSLTNQCSNICPPKTYTYQNECLFQCPNEYIHDIKNYQCVLKCEDQQYLDDNKCLPCSIECNRCYNYGNNNCIECALQFNLNEKGFCQGECSQGYYLNEQQCEKCPYKCLTCKNQTQCLMCRGTNRNPIDCSCQKGYYDDEFYENCQQCPCEECISNQNCLVCKNNLQIPKCNCDRKLNDDWCITCQVAKVKIQYSDDLNQIVVYFGYLISVNLINPFQPSDCSLWFDNSNFFGQNSKCYLSWDRFSVHIQLSPYSTIKVGDQLDFRQYFYRDVDQGVCEQEYLKEFIENKLYPPNRFIKPYILFNIPQYVTTCKQIEIRQILNEGTGQKLQTIIDWQLHEIENENTYLNMDSLLADSKNEIIIPMSALQPNTKYTITAKYINMFQRVNYTTFQFNTLPIQTPYVYLTYNPLIVNIYVFDCHITFADLFSESNIQISITNSQISDLQYISFTQSISTQRKIPLNESLLPKEQPLIFTALTQSFIIKEIIIIQSKPIEISFLQKNRFIGQEDQINARAYDKNIEDQILSTKNIDYQWLCNNLHDLQPCKTQENKIIEFPTRRIVHIQPESQNSTFIFYVRASKDKRWSVREQIIVLLDLNIQEEFVINTNQPKDFINFNSEITILLKKSQKYAFVIQNHKVLYSIKILNNSLKFRLVEITNDSVNPVYIYLIPGTDSLAFKIQKLSNNYKFTVEPKVGKALDYFNYTIENLINNQTISIFYYFEYETCKKDLNDKSVLNGIPLIIKSQITFGQFQLPSGISNHPIQLVCQVESNEGALLFLQKEIVVERRFYQMQTFLENINNQVNFSNLQSLHTMITLINSEDKQACLKQCSGVGICVNQKCQCPPGYYFNDCSGNQVQKENFNDLILKIIKTLIQQEVTNNDEFKLYSQAILQFQQYTEIISKISIDECQKVLMVYISNINQRMEQINQYSINMQYYQTNEFQYSQIDTRQILNIMDLKNAILSTEFIWNKAISIQNASIYQLMYNLNNFFINIIDLSFLGILPNQVIEISMNTLSLIIQRTNNLSVLNTHRLLQQEVSSDYYDIVQALYIINYYSYDGYFPYPYQKYPLYDYKIKQQNRYQNFQLQKPIHYKFVIQNDTSNLVCISRNSETYEWTSKNCYLSIVNSSYFCICKMIEPVTICDDYQYIYSGEPPFYLKLPNFVLIVYLLQLILLTFVSCKSKYQNPKQIVKSNKYGKVFKLNKIETVQMMIYNNIPSPINSQRIYPENDCIKETVQQSNLQEKNKFQLNYFWNYHYLTAIIFKKKFYFSSFQNVQFILLKWNICFILGEILTIYYMQYDFQIYILLVSIFINRMNQEFWKKQFKYYEYMKSILILSLTKIMLVIVTISSFIIGGYLYFWINNQTNLILSYSISNLIDLLFLDIILFLANKYLGQTRKKLIKKKIKEFKTALQGIKRQQN